MPLPPTVADLGERALIDRIRARVPPPPDWVLVGIGDDAAVVEGDRNSAAVVTTDAGVEGVHFDRTFVPPAAIGFRGLAANLSDLAAMGARPRAALLSLALPDGLPVADFDGIVDGVLTIGAKYDVALVGGNIARSSGPLVVDITAMGAAARRRILRRLGARPGDDIYVSGTIGAAAAGLAWCRANGLAAAAAIQPGGGASDPRNTESATADDPLRQAAVCFLYPDPRIRLGWVLARTRAATSCVDLRDGFADAIHQLAGASGVGAIVESELLPISAGSRDWFEREGADPVRAAIAGGEDYELVFTVPGRRRRLIEAVAQRIHGLALTRVGVVTRNRAVVLRRAGREEAMPEGFAHFR